MTKKTIREIKLRSGEVIPQGTEFTLTGTDRALLALATDGSRAYRLGFRNANKNFGLPFMKEPTLRTLERWSNDCVAKTVIGGRIEPDGRDQNGFPSWLLVLGLI